MTEIYAARWVLPIDGPPIEGGEVVVEEGAIAAVRPRRTPAAEVRDLGNAVLMPGLVNAHTHLEYTAQRGFLEDVPFFPWIRTLTMAKAVLTHDDWLASARLGAAETIAAGVTTIGDNTDAGVTARTVAESGIRGVIFQEFFGIDPRQEAEGIWDALRRKLADASRYAPSRVTPAISPHAPYTVRAELFSMLRYDPDLSRYRTSVHLAESSAEVELIRDGRGPFAEMFVRREIPWTPFGASPTRYLDSVGALHEGALMVHCVHQDAEDVDLIAQSGAAIAHCPKSNGKLAAGIAPLARWLKTEGLTVALGTDSAVSNNTLDLFEEMRFALLLARAASRDVEAVTAHDLLRMATLNGAVALGLESVTGSLTVGKKADLIAVDLGSAHATPATSPEAALVYSTRADDVILTVCDGELLYDRRHWLTLDIEAVRADAEAVREKFAKEQNGKS